MGEHPKGASGARAPEAVRRFEGIYVAYYVAQALVGVALWITVATSKALHDWMQIDPTKHAVADAFAFPDLAIIVVASLASAAALWGDRSGAVPLTALTAGAVLYPTVYLVGFIALSGGTTGTFAFTIMIPPSCLSSWIAYHVWSVRR